MPNVKAPILREVLSVLELRARRTQSKLFDNKYKMKAIAKEQHELKAELAANFRLVQETKNALEKK